MRLPRNLANNQPKLNWSGQILSNLLSLYIKFMVCHGNKVIEQNRNNRIRELEAENKNWTLQGVPNGWELGCH